MLKENKCSNVVQSGFLLFTLWFSLLCVVWNISSRFFHAARLKARHSTGIKAWYTTKIRSSIVLELQHLHFSKNLHARTIMATPVIAPIKIAYWKRGYFSRIDSVLVLILKWILPLLFFTAIIITGTLIISYTSNFHRPLPQQFSLGISVTFGTLVIVTAACLVLYRMRRFNQRRAAFVDLEASRQRQADLVVETSSRTRSSFSLPENAGRVATAGPKLISGSGPRLPQITAASEVQLREPEDVNDYIQSTTMSAQEPIRGSSSGSETKVGAVIQEPEPAHILSPSTLLAPPTALPAKYFDQSLLFPPPSTRAPPLRRSSRSIPVNSPRTHSLPSNDHPGLRIANTDPRGTFSQRKDACDKAANRKWRAWGRKIVREQQMRGGSGGSKMGR